MENIISKLSKIETAAANMMEDCEQQKKDLEQEFKQKTIAFQNETEAKTKKRLQDLQASLEAKTEARLTKIRQETDDLIVSINQEYQDNHQKLARNIFQRIIGE